jgi:high affinity Mn2+ porin
LSGDHRDYLASGGYGFLIGDGKLNYAPEEILETYYLFHMMNHLDVTGDYQLIENPAYNKDRGPVSVFSLRMHIEI